MPGPFTRFISSPPTRRDNKKLVLIHRIRETKTLPDTELGHDSGESGSLMNEKLWVTIFFFFFYLLLKWHKQLAAVLKNLMHVKALTARQTQSQRAIIQTMRSIYPKTKVNCSRFPKILGKGSYYFQINATRRTCQGQQKAGINTMSSFRSQI